MNDDSVGVGCAGVGCVGVKASSVDGILGGISEGTIETCAHLPPLLALTGAMLDGRAASGVGLLAKTPSVTA